jgi:hypothetical protein
MCGHVVYFGKSLTLFLSLIQTTGALAYIANFRLLAELSSPFVNQR